MRYRHTLAVVVLAAAAVPSAPLAIAEAAPAETPRPAFAGAAALFSVSEITVVYPAGGDAERSELGRRSAEHRAAYLRYRGVEATVAADDAVTSEMRSGHLLLLGWDNALLPEGVVVPAARGRTVFGIPVGPDEDILFAAASPWASGPGVVFWSRIDPELDRLVPIPFLGSQWGVYRGHRILGQGMFAEGAAWPPRRSRSAERAWGDPLAQLEPGPASAHYRLHALPGTVDAETARAILAAREDAYRRAVGLLGDPGAELRIELYVYEDRETKREISGIHDPVHSVPGARELHAQLDRARQPHPHEEIHIVAGALWGPCRSLGLYEGLALALSGVEGELDRTAALLRELGEVPPVGELLDEAALLAWNGRQLGLSSAGLLVRFILDRGGPAAVARVYGDLPPTAAAVAAAIGVGADRLDAAFGTWVRELGLAATDDLRVRRALEVAARLGESADWAGAATALAEAVAVRPDDPEALYSLGLMELRAGRRADAERRFRHLVTLSVSPAGQHYVVFGHYQLGQLLETDRPDEARVAYRAVLALPDRYRSHEMAREALEKLGGTGE